MRDPISNGIYFAKSLANDWRETLKTSWEGVKHFGDMPTFNKITTPVFGGAGLFLAFSGAATGDPVAATIGVAHVGIAGGFLLENGEDALAKSGVATDGPKPPAPPPPL